MGKIVWEELMGDRLGAIKVIANAVNYPSLSKIAALDMFTGNGDRHAGNLFISEGPRKGLLGLGGPGEKNFFAIDDNFAFSQSNVKDQAVKALDAMLLSKQFYPDRLDEVQRTHRSEFGVSYGVRI